MLNSRKKSKVGKMRGSNSHGWGYKKKHRGSGSKGGKGNAGSFKQKKSWFFNNDRKHLGKAKGFKSLKEREITPYCKAINLRDIAALSGKNGLAGEIDLHSFGYEKVLASGELKTPMAIKAKCFSKHAEEKISKAGGKAIKV